MTRSDFESKVLDDNYSPTAIKTRFEWKELSKRGLLNAWTYTSTKTISRILQMENANFPRAGLMQMTERGERRRKILIPNKASCHFSPPKHFIESGVPVAFLNPFSMDMIQPQLINSIHLHHYGGLSETMFAYWRIAGMVCLSERQLMPFPVSS